MGSHHSKAAKYESVEVEAKLRERLEAIKLGDDGQSDSEDYVHVDQQPRTPGAFVPWHDPVLSGYALPAKPRTNVNATPGESVKRTASVPLAQQRKRVSWGKINVPHKQLVDSSEVEEWEKELMSDPKVSTAPSAKALLQEPF